MKTATAIASMQCLFADMEVEQATIRNLMNDMADGVLIIGFDGTVNLHNPAAASILGLPESALSGKRIADLMQHHASAPEGAERRGYGRGADRQQGPRDIARQPR